MQAMPWLNYGGATSHLVATLRVLSEAIAQCVPDPCSALSFLSGFLPLLNWMQKLILPSSTSPLYSTESGRNPTQ
jgi:hypothetical protein